MDRPAARPRHFAHRPGLQPARGRPARRVRHALGPRLALGLALLAGGGCGGAPAPDPPTPAELQARFEEGRWDDVGAWRASDLVAALRSYVGREAGPIYPKDGPRSRELLEHLVRTRPDPAGLRPLLGPIRIDEVDDQVLKRDLVAFVVVSSFVRRLEDDVPDPHRAALHDALAEAGVHFSFEPAYGEAHTQTGLGIADFFSDAATVSPESRAALARHFPALLARWRGRVSRKATSVFFGIALLHLGPEVAGTLVGEWEGMHEDERFDLLERLADEERVGPAARARLVEALLDPSLDVRAAARRALEAHGAPVGDLDPSAREQDIRRALGPLRRWAETEW